MSSAGQERPGLARSAEILRDLFGETLDVVPEWALPLGFTDYFGIRHRRFRDQLADMLADAEERITLNRRAGELTISFGGDTTKRVSSRSVPDFALKGRFVDQVKLDSHALRRSWPWNEPASREGCGMLLSE